MFSRHRRPITEPHPRPVWIVTSGDSEQHGGLLATWVMPASLDLERPAALVALAPHHYTAELVDRTQAFVLHLLRRDQLDLALEFALGSGRDRDKLAGVAWSVDGQGVPRLDDCYARASCRLYARLATGDRIFYWADMDPTEEFAGDGPLTDIDLLARADAESRRRLREDRARDIALLDPHWQKWREELPLWLRPK